MKIAEARKIYASQLDTLWGRKRELGKLLEKEPEGDAGGLHRDRVELSKQLSQVEKQYDQTKAFMEKLYQKETGLYNAAVAKQQGDTMAEAVDDVAKCMEIARRISSGAKVPPEDEKKLMEYSRELYMAVKAMAMMAKKNGKKYDSLVEEEDGKSAETKSASEIAGDAEVGLDLPEIAAGETASSEGE